MRTAHQLRPFAIGKQWSVSDTHGREFEQRPQVKGQTGPPWMVTASGVDQENIRRARQFPHHRLQQGTLSQGQQPGLVAGSG